MNQTQRQHSRHAIIIIIVIISGADIPVATAAEPRWSDTSLERPVYLVVQFYALHDVLDGLHLHLRRCRHRGVADALASGRRVAADLDLWHDSAGQR
jgi:hypothetical protein